MIIFDQLRISDDGKRFYINLHVNKATYFENIYLNSLTIITADKVSETNPYEPTSDYIYKKVFEDNQKEADLVLTADDFIKSWEEDPHKARCTEEDMAKNLFFVYVKVKGTPDECTPCRLDEEITVGVTFDESRLYQMVMQHTKELADTCEIPKGLIDLILLWNGFKSAIETEHFIPAIDFWRKMFDSRHNSSVSKAKPCGCHG